MTLTKKAMQQREDEGLPTEPYPLRIRNDRAARAELAAATAAGDPDAVAAARTRLEGCYQWITLQALVPDELEKLLAEHKPTEQQQTAGLLYNPDTFPAVLLEACILDSEISAADWQEYLTKGPMTQGEGNSLFNAVWDLNYRGPDMWFPKGWTPTPNSS